MNDDHPYTVAPARSVLIPLAAQITGYTAKAIECKIERGEWEEDKVWHRAPDGRIHILMEGYHKWAAGRPQPGSKRRGRLASSRPPGQSDVAPT